MRRGESGCGKTTVSRCIVRASRPTSGAVRFRLGDGPMTDIASLDRKGLSPLRSHMQMIFQDPFSSLNPRMTVGDIIAEPMLVSGIADAAARRAREHATDRCKVEVPVVQHIAPDHKVACHHADNLSLAGVS
jgi:ABC-type microcin C transport system duplicated ATPase subunit YejF